MELSIVISPEDEEVVAAIDASLASPMSKHQRKLSLSAKWASNKALALEYLKRQREVILWMEHILGDKLPSTDLHESLKSGIVLRELLEKLFPDETRCLSPISRKYSTRMAPWKERENISVFLKQCKALGMNDLSLFCTDDLYDGNNMVQVMFCVQDFMRFSQEHSGHFLHPVYDEHVTFSNQEVEMALSKIEKAGMDAIKLKDLMNGSGSVPSSPGKEDRSGSEDFEDTDADSLLASSDTEHGQEEDEDDVSDENALSELEAELQALAARESFCGQFASKDQDLEPEIDGESDIEDDEEGEFDDEEEHYEEEIVDLLNDLVGTVEEAHEAELDDESGSGDHETGEEEMKYSVETRLEADLEEAKLTRLPESPAASSEIDILLDESEVLVNFSAEHRVESEARTELMDIGKSDMMVLDAAGRSEQAQGRNDETAASGQDAKPSKKKSKAAMKRKKNRELSDEQLDAEAMSRCTCGNKCSIM